MIGRLIKLSTDDNVGVALKPYIKGDIVAVDGNEEIKLLEDIPSGYKVALHDIAQGTNIMKYGASIGITKVSIKKGEQVHTHNLQTGLKGKQEYQYRPNIKHHRSMDYTPKNPLTFYRRPNGKCGIRNEIWVLPTVGCVNGIAQNIIRRFYQKNAGPDGNLKGIDGVYSFSHPYGCSQLGEDHENTKMMLQNMVLHPNAGGVLILGLGCENNQIKAFRETMPEKIDSERVIFMESQYVDDEIEYGVQLLEQLYPKVAQDRREPGDWSDLVLGLECGGSDAFSGITANPLIGSISDFIVSKGGSSILTEVPEMFGAEHILMEQCGSESVFHQTVDMINDYKDYYKFHNQPIYENPSPGNKSGGISTLEEKSLGCIRKSGNSEITDVIKMQGRIEKKGLNLLYSPGNDIVATTTLGTAGSQLVLFSTGRGTPLGGFIPTLKVATNSELANRKKTWIDFDAGELGKDGTTMEEVSKKFLDKIVQTVNGEPTKAETNNIREIAFLKTGVTL